MQVHLRSLAASDAEAAVAYYHEEAGLDTALGFGHLSVSEGGLEPPRPYWALAPQASASANSATPTWTPGNRRRGHPIAPGLPCSTRLPAGQRSSRRPVIGQQSQAERISQDLVYLPALSVRPNRLLRQLPTACSPFGRPQPPTGLDHRVLPGPTTTTRHGQTEALHRPRCQPWTVLAVPQRFTPQAYAEFGCSGSASGVDNFYVVGTQSLVGGHKSQCLELSLGNEHPVEWILVVGGKRRGMFGVVR